MAGYIAGTYNKESMLEQLSRDTRRYAKRQYTWFRKIENLQWLEIKDINKAGTMVETFINDVCY